MSFSAADLCEAVASVLDDLGFTFQEGDDDSHWWVWADVLDGVSTGGPFPSWEAAMADALEFYAERNTLPRGE